MTKHTIAFQKGFIITENVGIDNQVLAMTVQLELMNLGYMLDEKAYNQFRFSDAYEIKEFKEEVIPFILKSLGGGRDYKPIYPGFPKQVMEMDEVELWFNQFIGYCSGGSFTAEEYPKEYGKVFEYTEFKYITEGSTEDFLNIFTTLASSPQSLTSSDLKVIEWFILNDYKLILPDNVPFKENLCVILGTLYSKGKSLDKVSGKLTTTDVLRVAAYMSGMDVSLPAIPKSLYKRQLGVYKFKNFSRPERRFLLELLEKSNCNIDEMKLKRERWLRLGEILHPGQYSSQYPKAFECFNTLRNVKVRTWYSKVNRAFEESLEKGLEKLAERPGEFFRRLDYLVRTYDNIFSILNIVNQIGHKVSNKVLFEVFNHFEGRLVVQTNRSIFVKGARNKISLPILDPINSFIVESIQDSIISSLKYKFSQLPELGECWIDERLKNIPLPSNMRSLGDSLQPVIRGERLPSPIKKNTIRAFVHWYDEHGKIDVDLHAYLFDSELKEKHHFGFNGSQNIQNVGVFSGDVRHRPGACAEYVDVYTNVEYKYLIVVINDYSGTNFKNIPECVVGIMERDFPEANKLWVPSTITNSFSINTDSRNVIAFAYDLSTNEYIHLDLDDIYTRIKNPLSLVIKEYLELPKLSVYDLIRWHIESRGVLTSKENAETHFLLEDFSRNYTSILKYM